LPTPLKRHPTNPLGDHMACTINPHVQHKISSFTQELYKNGTKRAQTTARPRPETRFAILNSMLNYWRFRYVRFAGFRQTGRGFRGSPRRGAQVGGVPPLRSGETPPPRFAWWWIALLQHSAPFWRTFSSLPFFRLFWKFCRLAGPFWSISVPVRGPFPVHFASFWHHVFEHGFYIEFKHILELFLTSFLWFFRPFSFAHSSGETLQIDDPYGTLAWSGLLRKHEW